ncbi:hypothetical protein PsorP6_003799 [Peronosclerospora sorghi]|uniref:Uncharacterized protein n=1 Tax=Peronosclerospora sorghi TaxID=230839 RepID=A0ACC0VIL6_9STRA|nr:hypothetical protein PsorP6_003799 [Peronosclerospora sorghi]
MKRRVARKRGTVAQPQRKKRALRVDAFDWSANSKTESSDVIASESEASVQSGAGNEDDSDEETLEETAKEKHLRMAKEYLEKITVQETGDINDEVAYDDSGVDDPTSARLQQDALEAMGKTFKNVAADYTAFEFDNNSIKFLQGHRLAVTSLCLLEDGKTAFSAAKDGSLLQWDLAQQKRTKLTLPKDDITAEKATTDNSRCILALAASSDGKFLASGGRDKLVRVWDVKKCELQESFSGHRDAVSALAFRQRSHSLFSGSFDRSIKHWNLTEMGYVETLFGHHSEVNGLDSLYKERVVSCGRDRSVRFWKIPEETQLVLYGNSGSMDCVKMITDEYYVTGGDDGSLSLWFNGRKKPVCVIPDAHNGKWISSVAVLARTDLVASGSSDGQIRLWQADLQGRTINSVASIPLKGFVNALCFDLKARFLLAGVGQEHRLGRWEKVKVKNGIAIIALPIIDGVEKEYNAGLLQVDYRDSEALKGKFIRLKNVKKLTGDPSCPDEVQRAKRAQKIEQADSVAVLDDEDRDDLHDDEYEREEPLDLGARDSLINTLCRLSSATAARSPTATVDDASNTSSLLRPLPPPLSFESLSSSSLASSAANT